MTFYNQLFENENFRDYTTLITVYLSSLRLHSYPSLYSYLQCTILDLV